MLKYFYELYYYYNSGENNDHYFHIGYFSSKMKASTAMEKLKDKPGFRDHRGDFAIKKFGVHVCEENIATLFELSHEYFDSRCDCYAVLGVYASFGEAMEQQKKYMDKMPYKDYPDGFLIADCKVNLIGWTEGFVVSE